MLTDNAKYFYFTISFMTLIFIGVLTHGLLPAILSGFLAYYLVIGGGNQMVKVKVSEKLSKPLFVLICLVFLTSLITIGVRASAGLFSGDSESLSDLIQRVESIIRQAREYIPLWAQEYLPANTQEWQEALANWLRDNAGRFSTFGRDVGMFLIHIIIGLIIGTMIGLKPGFNRSYGPLAQSFAERVTHLGAAFQRIVFSQIRISALNTFLTGLFLYFVMPMIGYELPLVKTMIAVTFIVGLMPIIGNLISNTVIILISLSVAPMAAVWSLCFLVAVHKLEYFINAQIIGTRIRAHAWELLIAMLAMETFFGLPGLIAAPIIYSYYKEELSARRLI